MKILFVCLGSLALVLGITGIFVPLLPTTPFLLLAAFLYSKGSTRLHLWLLNHKYIGTYIRKFNENRSIPLRAKVIAMVMMWASILSCTILTTLPLWAKLLLILIAIGASWHILSFKTG